MSYPFKASSIICLVFNLFTFFIIVFHRKTKLKSTLYNHLIANIFINTLVCLTSFDAVYYDEKCYLCDDSYKAIVYRYVIALLYRYSKFSSSISDIILMLNRFYQISAKNNFLVKITISFNIFICLTVPSVTLFPLLKMIRIEVNFPMVMKSKFLIQITMLSSWDYFI